MECMQFLHNYGKILFFDRTEEESLLIILDANWLYRVMCALYAANNIGRERLNNYVVMLFCFG
jgi:hypothetical protein